MWRTARRGPPCCSARRGPWAAVARSADHFADAQTHTLHWPDVAVRPNLDVQHDQLVGLVGAEGSTRALARIDAIDREACTLRLHTPLASLNIVDTVHGSDVRLDPASHADTAL